MIQTTYRNPYTAARTIEFKGDKDEHGREETLRIVMMKPTVPILRIDGIITLKTICSFLEENQHRDAFVITDLSTVTAPLYLAALKYQAKYTNMKIGRGTHLSLSVSAKAPISWRLMLKHLARHRIFVGVPLECIEVRCSLARTTGHYTLEMRVAYPWPQ